MHSAAGCSPRYPNRAANGDARIDVGISPGGSPIGGHITHHVEGIAPLPYCSLCLQSCGHHLVLIKHGQATLACPYNHHKLMYA